MITEPFVELLRKLFEIPEVRNILHNELGADYVLDQFASDTPVLHSEYQQVHWDGSKSDVTGYPNISKSADVGEIEEVINPWASI